MNKSRRMAALQARALSQAGHAVLQIDLLGCGDSSGDFGDASWARWLEDIVRAAAWLRARCPAVPLWLWGLRAGCLLAAEAAHRLPGPCHLLFWAPPASGRLVLQQFLRLKAAGDLLGGPERSAREELRRQRAAGLPIEVAGYTLAPALTAGLEAAVLLPPSASPSPLPDGAARLVWLELSQREDAALSATASQGLAAWHAAGYRVHGQVVRGPAFWQSAEIETAPALLEATLAGLMAAPQPPASAFADSLHLALAKESSTIRPGEKLTAADRQHVEEALCFGCEGESLLGILHRPASALATDTGVVVIVGGPQYRAGSHRQFVLLARQLAEAGHAVLRFDVRGMGDSSGAAHPGFEHIGPDIAAAIDALQQRQPQVRRVVLWGLCDGASAALLYLDESGDPRVCGLCLANPWVRSPTSLARTQVKHYYAQRLLQPAFWRKLLHGQLGWRNARGLLGALAAARARPHGLPAASFQQRMAQGWQAFGSPILLLLSGEDYTAKEFLEHAAQDGAWSGLLAAPRVERIDLPAADHTFSGPGQCADASRRTLAWMCRALPCDRPGGARSLPRPALME